MNEILIVANGLYLSQKCQEVPDADEKEKHADREIGYNKRDSKC
jgi:hypothetical protein